MSKRATALYSALAAACFAYVVAGGLQWQEILDPYTAGRGVILRGQPAAGGVPVYSGAYQNIQTVDSVYAIQYQFVNFNSDNLWVQFQLDSAMLDATAQEFGFTQSDMDALAAQYRQAVADAQQNALDNSTPQDQLNAQLQALDQDYKRKQAAYLASKGFKLLPGDKLEIDMPKLVHRNSPRLQSLAQAFSQIAGDKNYDSDDTIGAVTAMIQTALFYKEPPLTEGARNIAGLLPPLEALTAGWGDCDTKTGVLASILLNWDQVRAIGVSLPTHYLMGIYRLPRHGDVYMEYRGLPYVLIEPAGPAWLPAGTVGRETMDMLEASDGIAIDPF